MFWIYTFVIALSLWSKKSWMSESESDILLPCLDSDASRCMLSLQYWVNCNLVCLPFIHAILVIERFLITVASWWHVVNSHVEFHLTIHSLLQLCQIHSTTLRSSWQCYMHKKQLSDTLSDNRMLWSLF